MDLDMFEHKGRDLSNMFIGTVKLLSLCVQKRHRQVVEFVCPKDVDIFTLDILRA